MEFLSQFLPIVIYFLLILLIVVVIVLGIKLIITIDKASKLVDEVDQKFRKIAPIIDTVGAISDKFNDIVTSVVSTVGNFFSRLFLRSKNKEDMESEDDE